MTNGVENNRPGVIPTLLKGAVIGSAAGWGASKLGFTKAAKYSSWQDVLKDSKDVYEAAAKDGASEAAKEAKTAIESAKTTFKDAVKNLGEKSDAYKNLSQLAERNTAKDAYKTKFTEFVTKAKAGELGFDAAGKTGDELTKEAEKHVRKLLKDGDDKVKGLKDALTTLRDKNKALKDHVTNKNLQIFKESKENIEKTIKEASDNAWNGVKDKVKDIKVPRTKAFVIGGAVLAGLLALMCRPKSKEA